MNILPRAWIKAAFVLPLCLAACMPVADSRPASISGGVYFDCDKDGECGEDETGIADMYVRLYYGACGENMVQTHKTDKNGYCTFSGLEPGEYCIFPDFELKTCGYGGNFPTTAITRHVTLESGMQAELERFGFGDLSGVQSER